MRIDVNELNRILDDFKIMYKKSDDKCQIDLKEMENLFRELISIYHGKVNREPTFMEISGYPHYEMVCSNILEFYFRTDGEHKLGDLFLKALIKTARIPIDNVCEVKVEREVETAKNNFIDLVIWNDEFAIGIENKIFSKVYNDLEDYANTVSRINTNSYNIILSLRDESEIANQSNYINVRYEELFESVKQLLDCKYDDNNKWIIFLKEFIQTIENLDNKENFMDREVINWAKTRCGDIENMNAFLRSRGISDEYIDWAKTHLEDIEIFMEFLEDLKQEFKLKILSLGRYFDENLQIPDFVDRVWLYNKNGNADGGRFLYKICVLEMQNSLGIAIDNKISIGEWHIAISFRNFKYAKLILKMLNKNEIDIIDKNERSWLLYKFDDNIDYDVILAKNVEILKCCKEAYENIKNGIETANRIAEKVRDVLGNYNVCLNINGNYLQVWKDTWDNNNKNGIHYEVNTGSYDGFGNLPNRKVEFTYWIHNEANTKHKYPDVKKQMIMKKIYSFDKENIDNSIYAIAKDFKCIAEEYDSYIDENIK